MSFRLKTILGIALIEICMLSLLVISGLSYLEESNETQLMRRAHTSATLFATMAADATIAMDLDTLDEMTRQVLENEDILYARIRHRSGAVLAQAGNRIPADTAFHEDLSIKAARLDMRLDVSAPIAVNDRDYGRVELGMSIDAFDTILQNAKNWMGSIAAIEIVLVAIFGTLLGQALSGRLVEIQKAARNVAKGRFGQEIKVKGRDELADTARSFNSMSRALASYSSQLEQERDRAVAGQANAESTLSHAINGMSSGVLITDSDGEIIEINKAFYGVLGRAVDTAEQFWGVLDGLAEEAFRPLITLLSTGKKLSPTRVTLQNGRHILISKETMDNGVAMLICSDITELMLSEEKSRELELRLLQAEKMKSLGVMAGGLAHEINTPLQFISANLEFLEEASRNVIGFIAGLRRDPATNREVFDRLAEEADLDFLKEEIDSAISQSHSGVTRVSGLINVMQQYTDGSQGDLTAVDLNDIVRQASLVLNVQCEDIADLHYDLDPELPLIMGDQASIINVLNHLVVNARDAIQETGERGSITVRTATIDGGIVLQVEDTGCGIPENIQDRVFEPFFTTKPVGQGTGQGLSQVFDLVTAKMGGTVCCSSPADRGAVFDITFRKAG